ncbi:MAG: lipopolysaccharide assembly protein LapA domain-containing protein [Rugosibacter sp.]|nr:lipopolysaccharide assembly protein LapA domain-containing protein [Rugosibacter sp.]
MQLTFIAALLIAIVSVLFALQNNAPVTVVFLLWRFDSSLALVLLIALALGAIAIALLTTPTTIRHEWLISRQKKRIDEQEKELQQLRDRIADLEKLTAPGQASAV